MAVIDCPQCNKRISSQARICRYCGFQLADVTQEDIEVFRARKLRDRIYHLNMASYLVITLFLVAFGWYWLDSGGFQKPPTAGPVVLMMVAAAAYIVVRALQFRNRQLQKELRRKINIGSELHKHL